MYTYGVGGNFIKIGKVTVIINDWNLPLLSLTMSHALHPIDTMPKHIFTLESTCRWYLVCILSTSLQSRSGYLQMSPLSPLPTRSHLHEMDNVDNFISEKNDLASGKRESGNDT